MLDKAQAIAPELIRLRREIHAHPELAFQEVRTAQLVAETLREIGGIDIRTGVGKTGVVGQLGDGNGPTIGIRADMDALPIDEATGLPVCFPGIPGVDARMRSRRTHRDPARRGAPAPGRSLPPGDLHG